MMAAAIRVALVDDQALARSGIRVVAKAADGHAASRMLAAHAVALPIVPLGRGRRSAQQAGATGQPCAPPPRAAGTLRLPTMHEKEQW